MNNPPEWLLSIFMSSLSVLSVLALLEIVVLVAFIVFGYFYRTRQIGKTTLRISLILACVMLIGFFYLQLVSGFLTLNIIGRFVFPALFYGITLWWIWRACILLKRNTTNA